MLCSNLAWAVSWRDVTRFSGSGDYTTDYFTCSHAEWAIVWAYDPISSYPQYAAFTVYVFPRDGASYIADVSQDGNTVTSGITYIHNQQGEFYLKFLVANLQLYSVTIMQDVDSVPEFSEFSSMILLSLLTTGILLTMILAREKKRQHRNPESLQHPRG